MRASGSSVSIASATPTTTSTSSALPGSIERLEAAILALDQRLEVVPFLGGGEYGLADVAYIPWVIRAETRLGLDLAPFAALCAWRDRLLERAAIAAEREVVLAL